MELSSLDPGLGARAQGEWRAASIARGSRRTRSKKRSGCITRQCWSSRLSRPDVCEGTPMYVCMYMRIACYPSWTPTGTLGSLRSDICPPFTRPGPTNITSQKTIIILHRVPCARACPPSRTTGRRAPALGAPARTAARRCRIGPLRSLRPEMPGGALP